MLRILTILLLLTLIPHVISFSAYSPICDVTSPQQSPHPVVTKLPISATQAGQTIKLTDAAGNPVTTYTPGVPITVMVTGVTRGLVLYAKSAANTHVGTWTIPANMQALTCTGITGMTLGHNGNIAKTNLQSTFTPPTTTGAITFQGMFTNPQGSKTVYQLPDVTITLAAAAPVTTTAPGTTTTAPGTTTTAPATTTAPVATTAPTTKAPTQPAPATLPPGTTVAPVSVPFSPTSVVAEAGNAMITIMWVAPLNNGGSPITSYTATCISPITCTIKPITVAVTTPQVPIIATTGVTNGVSYVFSVVANNTLGASKPVQTMAVTPSATASVPSPPTNILVIPQNAAALVSWTLPVSSGGSPITGYIVSAYPGNNGVQAVARVTTISMSATLTGLTPGMSYQFAVVAVNKNGMSTAAQTAINVLIPVIGSIAVPNVITGLFAAGHDRTATLTWDKPTTTNIVSYVLRNNLGQIMNVTGQPVTFDGLMNFVPYTFDIAAVNVAGIGPFSAVSNLVVPAALSAPGSPGTPSNVMATTNNGAVTVTWTAGTVGASITTTYWVIASTGQNMSVSAVATAAAGPAPTMATFPAGTLQTGDVSFVVVAANTQGTSQPSMLSTAVTVTNPIQQRAPGNPTITGVTVGTDGMTVTVTFDPPTDTGNSDIVGYTAYTSDMAVSVTGPSSPLVLNNVVITDGLTVYVLATNMIGTSMPDVGAAAPIPKPMMMMTNQTQGFTQRGFTTTWKINPVDQTITFTMTGQCTGYISIGFASGPLMANNADYYTGYIDDNTGTLVFSDTFSTSHAAPAVDDHQDIISATGTQVNGVTTITFTRLLVTGDTNQDFPIENKPIYVHWAIANADDLVSYHTDRDVQLANLFTGQATAVNLNKTWNAAYLLCIIALAVFMLYATVRWVYKLVKMCRHRRHIMTLERTSSSSQVMPVEHSKSVSQLQTSSQVAMVRAQAKSLSEYHAQLSGTHDETSENRSLQSNPALNAWGAGSSLSSQQMENNNQGHRRMVTSVGPSPINANSLQQKNWEAQWQALQTEEGWTYYYNEKTQETAWEIPPMPDYFEGRGARYSIASPTQRDAVSVDSVRIEQIPQRSAIPPSAAAARYALAKKSNRMMAQLYAIFHYRIPKTQFSLNQILVFIAYVVINIICLMVVDQQTEMATRWGWLACGNFVLVALPATRNSVLIWVLGYSFDVVMVFHRWIGRFVFVVTSAHMFGWYYLWYQQGLSIYQQQFQNLSYARGFYAWLALLVVQILSLDFFRRRHFEFFYHTHFTFVVCYVMAYLHEPQQGPYYTAILIIYLLDRAVRMFWGLLPRKTTLLQAKGGDILQVRFPKHPLARAANLYKVGQYVFVNFPQLSLVQWHPFSISSAPDERTAEIHIRSLGDYTRTMLQKVKANKQQDLWIRVDGPYGSHRLTYHRYPVLILVGGGIGITPIISILKDIYHVGDFDPKSTPKVNAIEGICCVWVIPNQATYEWFADEFEKLVAASQNPMMPPLFLWVYVTRDSNLGANSNFVSGKPDFDHIFSCAAKDYRGKATCVFACGPEMMVGQAWDATNTRKRAGDTFTFHHETFEW